MDERKDRIIVARNVGVILNIVGLVLNVAAVFVHGFGVEAIFEVGAIKLTIRLADSAGGEVLLVDHTIRPTERRLVIQGVAFKVNRSSGSTAVGSG